jgi:hypothetical protein
LRDEIWIPLSADKLPCIREGEPRKGSHVGKMFIRIAVIDKQTESYPDGVLPLSPEVWEIAPK